MKILTLLGLAMILATGSILAGDLAGTLAEDIQKHKDKRKGPMPA